MFGASISARGNVHRGGRRGLQTPAVVVATLPAFCGALLAVPVPGAAAARDGNPLVRRDPPLTFGRPTVPVSGGFSGAADVRLTTTRTTSDRVGVLARI